MTISTIYSKQRDWPVPTIDGLSKEDFLADKRTQQAVILNIVVIGDAATKLARDYPEFIEQHPDIPWKSMKGMRNRIAHGYFDINLDIVWNTVQAALPRLAEQITAIHGIGEPPSGNHADSLG